MKPCKVERHRWRRSSSQIRSPENLKAHDILIQSLSCCVYRTPSPCVSFYRGLSALCPPSPTLSGADQHN
eukprot:gene17042-biopygen4843